MIFASDSLGASRLILLFALVLTITLPAQGQTSVWLENPVDNRFDRAANWSTGIVPGSGGNRGGTAEFGSSSITSLTLEDFVRLEQIIFAADTDSYTIDMGARHEGSIVLLDGDIINNSSEIQTFDLTARMLFSYANAGNQNVHYHIQGPYGLVHFDGEGVAGDATYQLSTGGRVWFERSSSSGDSRFIMDGGEFRLSQSAPVSIGSLEGSGGQVVFNDSSARLLVGSLNNDTIFGGSITEDLSGDSGTLEKIGTGTLSLTGTTDHTGGTVITEGTLQIGDGGTSGSLTGDVTNNASLAFNRSDDITFDGIISGTGELIKKGGGTLTLTSSNTYTGGNVIEGGTLRISDIFNLGSFGDLTFNGGTLENTAVVETLRAVNLNAGGGTLNTTADLTLNGVVSGPGQLTKTGSNTLTLNGSNTYTGGTTLNSGELIIGNDSALGTGDLTINGGTLSNGGTARNTTNNIVANSSFTMASADEVVFGETNGSFNIGGLNVAGPGIAIDSPPSGEMPRLRVFGAVTGSDGVSYTAPQGGFLRVEYYGTTANTLTGTTTVGNRARLRLGKAGVNAIADDLTIDVGGFVSTESNQIEDNATLTLNGGYVFIGAASETIGTLNGSGEISTSSTGNSLTVNDGNYAGTFNTYDSGPLELIKQNTGTLTLSGDNSSTWITGPRSETSTSGFLQIDQGKVKITGNVPVPVTVNAGGTLGGDGTLGGNIVINTGATLAPGNSPGTLTVDGDLTLAGLTVIEIAGLSSFDHIDVGGEIDYGGDLFLDFSFLPSGLDSFDIFDFSSETGSFANIDFSNPSFAGTFDNTTGILSLTAVPEPEMFGLLAGLLGLGLAVARRRRNKERSRTWLWPVFSGCRRK